MNEELERELKRRFVTAEEVVALPGGEVTLLKPRNTDDLISEVDFVKDERLPYWADLWPSSPVLAAWISGLDGRGKSMLELGCGLGLVTLAAMRAGFSVMATDYYEDSLLFTQANASRATGREPRTRMVDWRSMPDDLGRFDLVVACDVLYEKPYAELVAQAMSDHCAPAGEMVMADPGRIGIDEFLAACEARGVRRVETIERKVPVGEREQTIRIYRFNP